MEAKISLSNPKKSRRNLKKSLENPIFSENPKSLHLYNHLKNTLLVCVCVIDGVNNWKNQPPDKAILRVGCDAKCIFAKSTRLTHVLSFASWQNEGFSFAFDLCKHTLERVVMRWIFSKILFSCSLLCLELAYKYSKYRYKISWLETGLKIPTF